MSANSSFLLSSFGPPVEIAMQSFPLWEGVGGGREVGGGRVSYGRSVTHLGSLASLSLSPSFARESSRPQLSLGSSQALGLYEHKLTNTTSGCWFFWNFTRLALQYFQTLSPPGQCLSQILPLRTSMFALKSCLPLASWLRAWARGAVYWMRRKVWGLIIIQRILPLFSKLFFPDDQLSNNQTSISVSARGEKS